MNTHSGASVNRTGHMANCQEASRAGLTLVNFRIQPGLLPAKFKTLILSAH